MMQNLTQLEAQVLELMRRLTEQQRADVLRILEACLQSAV